MKHLFLLIIGIISIQTNYCFSQLQLNPVLGLAVTKNYLIGNSHRLIAVKGKELFLGFELNKQINSRFSLTFPYHFTSVSLIAAMEGVSVYKFPIDKPLLNFIYGKRPSILDGVGTGFTSFGVIGEYSLFQFNRMDIKSSLGFTINRVQGTCFDCSTVTFPDNPDTTFAKEDEFYDGVLYTKPGYGNYIIKNRHSVSINIGAKFQFKNKIGEDKLSLKFMYSQGLMTVFESPISRLLIDYKDDKPIAYVASGTFQTKGTYWTIFASYPITFINKKGKRYRDRHPKEL